MGKCVNSEFDILNNNGHNGSAGIITSILIYVAEEKDEGHITKC